jgi:tetratricopeptide (TPR) repeat protein
MSRILCGLVTCCLLMPSALADDSPEASLQFGIANLRLKKFKEAIKPLDDAFKSAIKEDTKLRAAEGLMRANRETADFAGYLDAADYVIIHNDRKAGRSVNASQVHSFIHFTGKTDEAIKRYEDRLKEDANDLAALNVLARIYDRSDRANKTRAQELNEKLNGINKEIATKHAKRLEAEAADNVDLRAWLLKDAAHFWLEASEPASALAAAKASTEATPEARSQILTYQYRDALGDIFLQAGETKMALEQFEAAVKSAPEGILKTNVAKKVEQAKSPAK